MATSGTYTFGGSTEVIDLVTEAYERCEVFGPDLKAIHLDSARRSMNLMFSEWANDGPALWAVDRQTQTVTQATANYTLDTSTVAIMVASLSRSGEETLMTGISRNEYQSYSDKTTQGRPTLYWLDRQITPVVYLYPTPENSTDIFVYYRLRALQDITEIMTQNADAPARWMEAICSGLAAKLSVKWAPLKFDMLQGLAGGSYKMARSEDRERVPLRLYPTMDGY